MTYQDTIDSMSNVIDVHFSDSVATDLTLRFDYENVLKNPYIEVGIIK